MILMENDGVCGFTFFGKVGFDGHPEFISVFSAFGVKLIKYCIFHVLELLHIYSIFIPFIQILPVYSSARFIIL